MNVFANIFKMITVPYVTYSSESGLLKELNDFALKPNGDAYFGSGNPGDNFDITRVFTHSFFKKELDTELGLKVHYRTSTEIGDYQNGQYYVDGGYQQDGVHGASGTNLNRSSTNVDFSVWKKDGDFSTTKFLIDTDSSTNEDFTVGTPQDLTNDGIIDAIVFDNGFIMGVGDGNGAEKGDLLADSFNWFFMKDQIDGGTWDGESGQLTFKIVDQMDQPNPFFNLFAGSVEQEVVVNFGPMDDPMGTVA